MPKSYRDIEEEIQDALDYARLQDAPCIKAIAKKKGVPYSHLLRRWNNHPSRSARIPPNRLLSEEQEGALVAYCERMDGFGLSTTLEKVKSVANQILKRSHLDILTDPPKVGTNWTKRFVKRYPHLVKVKQRAFELARVVAHSKVSFEGYFDRLRTEIDRYGIQPQDIWNTDEVGFRIGWSKDQWILTLNPSKTAYLPSNTDRTTITSIETINVAGNTIPPLIILPGKLILEAWFHNDLPDETLIGVTASGYTDDILGLQWLKHFEKLSRKYMVGTHRLLLLDGHKSHTTMDFITYCDNHNIIPFCLPPHSTHLLQPLDLAVFSPFKHYHQKAVADATQTGCTHFNKVEFLAALHSIRKATFKPNTIKTAWRVAGIAPWDPDSVIDQLEDDPEPMEQPMPWYSSPPHTPPPSSPHVTPKTLRSLMRVGQAILDREEPVSPTTARFIKGGLINAQVTEQLASNLHATTAASRARADRNSRKRIVASGGVMLAGDARRLIAEREEELRVLEERQEWMAIKRLHHERAEADNGGWKNVFKALKQRGRPAKAIRKPYTKRKQAGQGDSEL